MTRQEIEKTAEKLHEIIEKTRHEHRHEKEIRVNMGIELFSEFSAYYLPLYMYRTCEVARPTIWGYPVHIDYAAPMLLEVCVVESVPIYKESEG